MPANFSQTLDKRFLMWYNSVAGDPEGHAPPISKATRIKPCSAFVGGVTAAEASIVRLELFCFPLAFPVRAELLFWGSGAPLEGRGGVEKLVEKLSARLLACVRGSARHRAAGALPRRSRSGGAPLGGRSLLSRGGLPQAPCHREPRASADSPTKPNKAKVGRRHTNAKPIIQNGAFVPRAACNCKPPYLAAEGGGGAAIIQKPRFVSRSAERAGG